MCRVIALMFVWPLIGEEWTPIEVYSEGSACHWYKFCHEIEGDHYGRYNKKIFRQGLE